MSRALRTLVILAIAGTLALSGCEDAQEQTNSQEPKVKPPVIAEAGVLRVGVDLDYAPFAGVDDSRTAGIDIDVADAIAAELGLAARPVSVEPTRIAEALAGGEIDVAMSVPITRSAMSGISLAGSYISDGPAFFVSLESTASAVETLTVESVGRRAIGTQKGSQAYWVLEDALGAEAVTLFPTTRDAMGALEAGEIDVLAADAVVAAYIARDFKTVRFAGQLEPAVQIGVAVSADADDLEEAVRSALDAVAARGVLDTIRTKWLEGLPQLEIIPPDAP